VEYLPLCPSRFHESGKELLPSRALPQRIAFDFFRFKPAAGLSPGCTKSHSTIHQIGDFCSAAQVRGQGKSLFAERSTRRLSPASALPYPKSQQQYHLFSASDAFNFVEDGLKNDNFSFSVWLADSASTGDRIGLPIQAAWRIINFTISCRMLKFAQSTLIIARGSPNSYLHRGFHDARFPEPVGPKSNGLRRPDAGRVSKPACKHTWYISTAPGDCTPSGLPNNLGTQ